MAKRAQLVSQHLENISSEALEIYQDIVRRNKPEEYEKVVA